MASSTTSASSPRKSPPGDRSYPFIGALLWLRRNPLEFLLDSARRHGDIVYVGDIGPRPVFLINHPDHVKYIVQDNNRVYDKGVEFRAFQPVTGQGLVAARGDYWRKQRRLIQPAFHRRAVSDLVTGMVGSVAPMVAAWEKYADRNQAIDVVNEMKCLSQTIVMQSMFSADVSRDAARLIPAWNLMTEEVTRRLFSALPFLDDLPTPRNRRFQAARQTLDTIVFRIIAERRKSGKQEPDLLTMLMAAHDEDGSGAMTDEQLRDELMTIFFGGQETTTNALGFTWYMLSKHPVVTRRLVAEVDEVLGGRSPTAEDLSKLVYTRMVIDESMRLYPPVWMYTRVAGEDDVVGGYTIPAGSTLVLSPWALHRHPGFWENPEGFDPERFSPERSEGRPRYAYFPFGGGPRQCIGNIFSVVEMQIVLAMFLQTYRLSLVPGTKIELSARLGLGPRDPIMMNVAKRVPAG